DDVFSSSNEGDTLSRVVESGCGKSTFARSVYWLVQADTGTIVITYHASTHESEKTRRSSRQPMQMMFKDRYACLIHKMKINAFVCESLKIHRPDMSASDREKTVRETCDICGIG